MAVGVVVVVALALWAEQALVGKLAGWCTCHLSLGHDDRVCVVSGVLWVECRTCGRRSKGINVDDAALRQALRADRRRG